jgi:hypothetical protein
VLAEFDWNREISSNKINKKVIKIHAMEISVIYNNPQQKY